MVPLNHFRGFVIDSSQKAFIHKTAHDYLQVERISRIIQYVYENYPYKISLSEIAEREQMSPYYLSHIFHKLVGVSFRSFLNMVRVEMSEIAVLSTEKSITQIAQDVGFSDAKYYIAHFYEHMGCHPKEYRLKYAHQIYGIVDPKLEEYPLSKLRPIISNYTQYPVFKKSVAKVDHIEMDCSISESIGRLSMAGSIFSAMDDLYTDLTGKINTGEDAARLYENVIPHESCIKALQDLVNHPESFSFPAICMFDRRGSHEGVVTANGLRKPLYYLANLLDSLPEKIIDTGPNYIALQGNQERDLLVFNPSSTDAITIDIIARNIKTNYKLTKYRLVSCKSFLNYWAQLNFSSRLSTDDIKNINYMSGPYIEYAIVPRWEQYYTSIELAPYDIMLLKFTDIRPFEP